MGMFVKMNLILPFSSQVLDHMAPGLFFEIPTPLTPQVQSISLLSDSPETRFSSSDRQLIPPLPSGLYLNAPSWGRDPTPHMEGISSILLFHSSCCLSLSLISCISDSL